jgi:hypothetical protein
VLIVTNRFKKTRGRLGQRGRRAPFMRSSLQGWSIGGPARLNRSARCTAISLQLRRDVQPRR